MTTATATRNPVPPAAPKPSRMTLTSLVKGKQQQPLRCVLYGVEGIGKSTFGANAPSPIFLGAEDGTAQLDVTRFPSPETWAEVLEAVRTLTNEEHRFETLVIDTLDWAEPLLWEHICRRDGQPNIEAYGYGKGYVAAIDEWRVLLAALERLRKVKGMHLMLIAHSWVKAFKNPEGDDFDRYEMKLHAKAASLVKEWSDCVLFTNYETLTAKDGKKAKAKGIDTGARLIYTQRRAAYDAKNRFDLPESLPLSWPDFFKAVQQHEPADPALLTAECQKKAVQLGGEWPTKIAASIKRAGGDAAKLAQLNSYLNAKLIEKGE